MEYTVAVTRLRGFPLRAHLSVVTTKEAHARLNAAIGSARPAASLTNSPPRCRVYRTSADCDRIVASRSKIGHQRKVATLVRDEAYGRLPTRRRSHRFV